MYNMKYYVGNAKYKSTNRMRGFELYAVDYDDCKAELLNKGFTEPMEIEVSSPEPATTNQIECAIKNNLKFPSDISKIEMTDLLSREFGGDVEASSSLKEYAFRHGLRFTNYVGTEALHQRIFSFFNAIDKTAFYIFSIYKYRNHDTNEDLDMHPIKEAIYKIAEDLSKDERFLKSMNNCVKNGLSQFGYKNEKYDDGSETTLSSGSTNSISYRMARSALDPLLYNKHQSKSITNNPEQNLKQYTEVKPNISYTPYADGEKFNRSPSTSNFLKYLPYIIAGIVIVFIIRMLS